MEEIWKPVVGWEDSYEVSNLGNIKSLDRYITTKNGHQLYIKQTIIKKRINNCGYERVELNKNGKGKMYSIHRLVAEAFLENFNKNLQVNHKNGIKTDNRIQNLEMVTAKENQRHSYNVLKTKPSMQGHFGSSHVRSIKVKQYDLNDNYIKTWNSLIEASKQLNINPSCISNNCRNRRKTAGGYIWKYVDK